MQDLKRYLSSPPILVAPKQDEPLLLYIAATNQVVSAVLVAERDEDVRQPEAGSCIAQPQGEAPCPAGSDLPEELGAPGPSKKKRLAQWPV